MTRDIAVVCAPPPGINPGMGSVDLALAQMAARHGLLERLALYRLYSPPHDTAISIGGHRLDYGDLRDAGPLASSRVTLYWGDFMHMRQYQIAVAHQLVARGISANLADADRLLLSVLLLDGQPDAVLQRAISFGTTLFVNNIDDETDAVYGPALARFLSGVGGLWLREPMSATKAAHITSAYASALTGVDCATLLDTTRQPVAPFRERSGDLGVFIGRTVDPVHVDRMATFALRLASEMQLRAQWIPWGDCLAFPPLRVTMEVPAAQTLPNFSDRGTPVTATALAHLATHRVVVSDTYHVCVNAWAMGIPAICMVENQFSPRRPPHVPNYFARRDKRELFMSMYDALDFLVPTNELLDDDYRDARVRHIAACVEEGRHARLVHGRIRQHAAASEGALLTVLGAALS